MSSHAVQTANILPDWPPDAIVPLLAERANTTKLYQASNSKAFNPFFYFWHYDRGASDTAVILQIAAC